MKSLLVPQMKTVTRENGTTFTQVFWVKASDTALADIPSRMRQAHKNKQMGELIRELVAEGEQFLLGQFVELDRYLLQDGTGHEMSSGIFVSEAREWYAMSRRVAVVGVNTSEYAMRATSRAFGDTMRFFKLQVDEYDSGGSAFQANSTTDDETVIVEAVDGTPLAQEDDSRKAPDFSHLASDSTPADFTVRLEDCQTSDPMTDEDMCDGQAEEELNKEHKARFFEYINSIDGSHHFYRYLKMVLDRDFVQVNRPATDGRVQAPSDLSYRGNDLRIEVDEKDGIKYAYGYIVSDGQKIQVTGEFTARPGTHSDPVNAVRAVALIHIIKSAAAITPSEFDNSRVHAAGEESFTPGFSQRLRNFFTRR